MGSNPSAPTKPFNVRVLYLCHRIPYPPNKGDKIRAFHQLRALAARHEVDLFTLADDAADLEHRAVLGEYCKRVTVARLDTRWARLRSLPYLCTRIPLTLPYFYSAELDGEVRKALRQRSYDRIFVYCSAMAQYVERVDGIPIVMDLVDVDSNKWTQYSAVARFPFSAIYRREGRCLEEYERRVCERSSAVVVTTEREAELVRRFSPTACVHVVANGIDTEYFRPAPVPADAATIVFTGDMTYFPNEQAVIYFARKVLPIVRASIPAARFLIVGRNPGRNVQRLRQIAGVEVTGFVPDVREYLAQAAVSVAPFLIAAGIQNKILEAMASGLPVVATGRVLQGVSKNAAAVVRTADAPEEMAARVVELCKDPRLARSIGIEGRRRVAGDYNWDQSLEQLLQIVEHPRGAYAECPAT